MAQGEPAPMDRYSHLRASMVSGLLGLKKVARIALQKFKSREVYCSLRVATTRAAGGVWIDSLSTVIWQHHRIAPSRTW